MNDTSPRMAAMYEGMLMARPPEERLCMGCSMFDLAKKIVLSAILSERPDADPAEIKRELFLRFYGHEFSGVQKERLLRELTDSPNSTTQQFNISTIQL